VHRAITFALIATITFALITPITLTFSHPFAFTGVVFTFAFGDAFAIGGASGNSNQANDDEADGETAHGRCCNEGRDGRKLLSGRPR
jgi:hypothetical protein